MAGPSEEIYCHLSSGKMKWIFRPAAPRMVKSQWNHLPCVSRRSGAMRTTPFASSIPQTFTFPPG